MIQKMIRTGVLLTAILLNGALGGRARAAEHAVFAFTHLAPSPLTLPAGHLAYGTSVAFGLTDFLTLQTHLLRDLMQFYNAQAKLALLDFPEFAFSLTLGWEHFNLKTISDLNPDVSVTSWQPGGVAAVALHRQVAWFIGGNLNYTRVEFDKEQIRSSGYIHGATLFSDLSWMYSASSARPGRRGSGTRRGLRNVLSAGMTYDLTYQLLGLGLSHHWAGFQLGVHYYPNADTQRLQPILVGGGSVQF